MVARSPWILPAAIVAMAVMLVAVIFGGSAISTAFSPSGAGTNSILHVPADYRTVQAAIDAAKPGDVIQVAPGTYNENIVLSKAVALAAANFNAVNAADNTTVLDGGNGQATVLIPAGLAQMPSIHGFVIRNSKVGIEAHSQFIAENDYFYGSTMSVEYMSGGGGINRNNVYFNSANDAIHVDEITVPLLIQNNRFMYAGDDSIELDLQAKNPSSHRVEVDVWDNMFIGSNQYAIKFVDYASTLQNGNHFFSVAGNLIADNRRAGIGFVHNGNTNEDYSGANTSEPVRVYNNTFYGNNYGISGGENLVAFNNIIADSTSRGAWRVQGPPGSNSVIAYTLFWGNAVDTDQTTLGPGDILHQDPLFIAPPNPGPDGAWGTVDDEFGGLLLQSNSPAIDKGVTQFIAADGEPVPAAALAGYLGAAPDLGWREAGAAIFGTATAVPPTTIPTVVPTATGLPVTAAPSATGSPTPALTASPTGTLHPPMTATPTNVAKVPLPTTTPQIGILSVTPTTAEADTTVILTITGFGFETGTAVGFQAGQGMPPEVAGVQVASSTTMMVTVNAINSTPRPQTWDLRVTNPDGTSFMLESAFTVNPR